MNNLPPGWVTAPLGDLAASAEQHVPDADEQIRYIDIGSIDRLSKRIVSPQHMQGADAPTRARRRVKTGDVLVSMTRPNLNAVALVPPDLDGEIASTGFEVLRPREVDPRWLYYTVRTPDFVAAMSGLVQGALYPAVRPADVRGYPGPLAPVAEQRRIADKLDALLARVDACRARLDLVPGILKRFRQAVLAAATSGELTRDWREEHGVFDAWPVVELGDVASDFSYGTAAKSSPTGDIPVVRMGNIQDGELDWHDLVYTSDPAEIEKYRLSPGDVLFNRTNSPELVGKAAVYWGERDAVYAGYLIRVRCSEHLLPDFLNYCLGSPDGRDYCWRVKSDGVSQSNINARKLAAFPLGLPTVTEQREIVRRTKELLGQLSNLLARHANAAGRANAITPSILSKAFRGELVTQDPNDEPAADLLARIHAASTRPKPDRPTRRTTPRERKPTQERRSMSKTRNDEDVRNKPYLARHLRTLNGKATVKELYEASELGLADFYKQLSWEVDQGHIRDARSQLEAT